MAKKKTAVNPLDLVAAAAKKTPEKKSKSKTPIVEVTDKKVAAAIVSWKDAKEREKDANSERKLLEGVMIPYGMGERRDLIQAQKVHMTSIKLKTDDATVTLKTSKVYSAISTDTEDDLREIFGDDDYDRLFTTHTKIAFKDEFATDTEVLSKVIQAIGAERFAEIFDVEQTIKATEVLIVERDMHEEIAEKHDEAVEQGLLKPNKPAFTL